MTRGAKSMDTAKIMEAYCLFDNEGTDLSSDNNIPNIWGMMVSHHKNAVLDGFGEELPNAIITALNAVGSEEIAEAYYNVPVDLVWKLPHDPQSVINDMNDRLAESGICDVRFALISNDEPKIEDVAYYHMWYGCIATADQLSEEGHDIVKHNAGFVTDVDVHGDGMAIYIKEVNESGEKLYIIGGELFAATEDECEACFDEILREDIYLDCVHHVYKELVDSQSVPQMKSIIKGEAGNQYLR